MRHKKQFKPTFHKANARYRGVTDKSQYSNFVLETTRDLLHLYQITTGSEELKGHQQEIGGNFLSVMTGDGDVGRSNLFTASILRKINKERVLDVPELSSWLPLNNCTIESNGDSFLLTSPALETDVGMYTTLYVEPGDNIYIRLKVKSSTGAPFFSFGSNNARTGPETVGNTRNVSIQKDGEYVLLDYIVHFRYAEAVSLNINVHENPDSLTPSSIEVKDIDMYYIDESNINLSPYHSVIKPELNRVTDEIKRLK